MNLTDKAQSWLPSTDSRLAALLLASVLAILALLAGLSLATLGPLLTVILLLIIAGVVWILSDLEMALWSIVGVIGLLPFATLPFKIVLTPSFLNMVMGAFLFLYLMEWMTGRRRRLMITPVHPLIALFMVLAIFSFVMGLRHAGLTSNVLRNFAELLLSISFALILVDILRSTQQLERLARIIIVVGAGAALIAIGLWLLPDRLAESALVRLSIIGYPGGGVIQYVEQNPELPERAIGTAVNPNSLGGYLVMVAALLAPQIMREKGLLGPRWLNVAALGLLVIALVLTFSRGSMLAFAVAMLFLAALRYRGLLLVLLVVGLALLSLPWTQFYIERFLAGLQGADLATQMRFGEYKDALTLIGRYPLVGAGFSGTPDIDIYLAVANVYLTIASNMGLSGLAAFLVLMATTFLYGAAANRPAQLNEDMGAIWLGALAALVAALFNGIFDHYFFNLEFSHAVLLFWTFMGISLAATRLLLEEPAIQNQPG